jgi:2-polyprenyl-3-methyl-5-hydroxy-6-metoxy-1,4-benzoquinol methylase
MDTPTTSGEQDVTAHFDAVARDYDYWKKKNWFYYDTLRAIARRYVAPGASLLDVGCGTGAMIEATMPARAMGIDVSPEMIEIAKQRNQGHPEYRFVTADITTFRPGETVDVVLFFDVIEHVADTKAALASLHELLTPGGHLVITMANPLWEPVLMVAERLGLKMPEGPHYRVPTSGLLELARQAQLSLAKREWHLLFPKYIPIFSWFINDIVGQLPLMKRLAVIEVFVFTRT